MHPRNNIAPTDLSLIMPAYNDAQAVDSFMPKVIDFCNGLTQRCEIIVVDDGSTDNIESVIRGYIDATKNSEVLDIQLIKLSRNFGKEAALSAGLSNACGELVALIDADGQHPIETLASMLTMLTNQPEIDAVAGIQAERPNEHRVLRSLKSFFYAFMQDTHRYELKPNAGDFRLMRRKVVNALMELPERQRFMKGLYAWVGFNTVYTPFTAEQRNTGTSKFNYASLFELAVVGITSFSQKPLRWISRMGTVVSFIAILYGLYIVAEKIFFDNSVSGWATLAAGIMFSAGLQLICLGLIGEYIGRLYEEVKQRPLYIIDTTINQASIDKDSHTSPNSKISHEQQ